MKKVPKFLQADARGQIVIPKEIREALGIDEHTAFVAYLIEHEGIFLKKIDAPDLSAHTKELKEKAEKIGVKKQNVEQAEEKHRRTGRFEDV